MLVRLCRHRGDRSAWQLIGSAPVDTGKNCPQEFPANTYPVGPYQMPPGRYVSEAPTNIVCPTYRLKTANFLDGNLGSVSMSGAGRMLLDVLPTDPYVHFRFETCVPLVPYVPVTTKAIAFDFGYHVVNQHIQPGTYRASRLPASVCAVLRSRSIRRVEGGAARAHL